MNKEQIEKELIKHGWTTWYHKDNWVHTKLMAGGNLDWFGVDLATAIKINNNKFETSLKLSK